MKHKEMALTNLWSPRAIGPVDDFSKTLTLKGLNFSNFNFNRENLEKMVAREPRASPGHRETRAAQETAAHPERLASPVTQETGVSKVPRVCPDSRDCQVRRVKGHSENAGSA